MYGSRHHTAPSPGLADQKTIYLFSPVLTRCLFFPVGSPSVTSVGRACHPSGEAGKVAAAQAQANWLVVFCSGVHAEARPVPAEHLPGPVPAAAPQEGAHAAQVHRGWYVSRRQCMHAIWSLNFEHWKKKRRAEICTCQILHNVLHLFGALGNKVAILGLVLTISQNPIQNSQFETRWLYFPPQHRTTLKFVCVPQLLCFTLDAKQLRNSLQALRLSCASLPCRQLHLFLQFIDQFHMLFIWTLKQTFVFFSLTPS